MELKEVVDIKKFVNESEQRKISMHFQTLSEFLTFHYADISAKINLLIKLYLILSINTFEPKKSSYTELIY